ncbi:unnamed protein product [Kuraishia capsulata CBS 1993]|uniref:Uncharacterized protein n=1 Tax=Kuraishia capsulata CBS 1993 TaxID=1382522 RepID=W6MS74_9ASCO|nr:uncharacterized protein KUCA_T00005634001 [Kuraishia capsulata CBS 1993]CDK29641.1 unnamed protein product [Kuraishia capsulata CBS 1993]
MVFKFLLLLTLKTSTSVASKPSKFSNSVSEITIDWESVTLDRPVLVKAGKVTQLMEPTEVKEPNDKLSKMVKSFNCKVPVIVVKESAAKLDNWVALVTIKSP